MENVRPAETSKSIFRNVVYNFSTWLIPVVLSFYATRIIIQSLGESDYGIYALVLGFIGYSFNFSFGRAITKFTAEYRSSGENDKIKDVISATFFINLIVGIVGVAIIFFIARLAGYRCLSNRTSKSGKNNSGIVYCRRHCFFSDAESDLQCGFAGNTPF